MEVFELDLILKKKKKIRVEGSNLEDAIEYAKDLYDSEFLDLRSFDDVSVDFVASTN